MKCAKSHSIKANLDRHVRIHTGEKRFSCNLCPLRFSYQYSLYKHMKIIHKKEPTDQNLEYNQSYGKESFENEYNMNDLQPCNVRLTKLSKSLIHSSRQLSLHRHMKTLTNGENPYSCEA